MTSKFTTENLFEEVYVILDSRIQYLEYKANNLMDYCLPKNLDVKASITQSFEQMMTKLKELSRSLKLLQILKSWLYKENASLVFDLLTNDKYLKYSEQKLERIIRKDCILIHSIHTNN